jgi:hypothetical protein
MSQKLLNKNIVRRRMEAFTNFGLVTTGKEKDQAGKYLNCQKM